MTRDMTTGTPLARILAFCAPLLVGNLFQQFYNLADSVIVGRLLGRTGLAIFALVVGLACVTTAVGLTSAAAAYFEGLFKGRLRYKALVILICACSALFANFGLDQIIAISAPVLGIVYPPTLVLILLAFFRKWLPEKGIHRMAALGALLVSLMEAMEGFGLPMAFLHRLPLSSLGFGWILPAAFFGVLGALFFKSKEYDPLPPDSPTN